MGLSKHYTPLLPLVPMTPRLYSYIVARDYGFAPNPFFGSCTLATCKPKIRRAAKIGDWVVGTGSKSKSRAGRIVYAMRVTDAVSFEQYWQDPRFRQKRPNLRGSSKQAFGDNIYHWDTNAEKWIQADSHHSHENGTPNLDNIERDTSVDRVLISNDFIYFGGDGPEIPDFQGKSICCTQRGHKSNFSEKVVKDFINWIRNLGDMGYCGDPLDWRHL